MESFSLLYYGTSHCCATLSRRACGLLNTVSILYYAFPVFLNNPLNTLIGHSIIMHARNDHSALEGLHFLIAPLAFVH